MRAEYIRSVGLLRAAVLLFTSLLTATAVAAAPAPDDDQDVRMPVSASAPSRSEPVDFFVGAPRAWIALRGNQMFPRAGGDLFTFVTDQLTLERSQFRSRGFSTDLGIATGSRFDIVGGYETNRHAQPSEYRHFVASNAQAITQSTELVQRAFTVGARYSPLGRGLAISRFAFIPRRVAPYVGGGALVTYYRFSQQGQFVDSADLSIFNDRFYSDGWSVGPYVNGGADVQVWRHIYVTFDGRYSWVHSSLGSDFQGFDGIDLAGFRASSGISVVF
ncbi:MAG: hypothetical protein U0Q11_18365 [Vicinamibacterales bacterium]